MKTMSVGRFKARFSEALDAVRRGETVIVTYGRGKRAAGVFAPPTGAGRRRRLGQCRGKVSVTFGPNWEISDEELAGS